MAIDALHVKYAPIMHFSQGERFFPMPVDDFLSYTALYAKGGQEPVIPFGQVRPDDLANRRHRDESLFLRSVAAGPLQGVDVAGEWGEAVVSLLYEYARNPAVVWTEAAARSAYEWFNEKTQEATKHFWWNSLLLPKAEKDKKQGLRADLPRLVLPQETRQSAIERYEASQGRRKNYTYYHRLIPKGGYLNLQYWFYYAYNDWANGYGGFNDHEGDWEGFHIFFELDGQRPIEPPAYVCYLGHHSRITKPWDHNDIQRVGNHPVIYVAAGSHASYPERKQYPLMALYDLIDYATGDAFTLDHSQWRSRLSLEQQPWLNAYRGSWGTRYWLPLRWIRLALGTLWALLPGEISLPGVSAPRGPKFDDKGDERETWGNMLEFAGIE